jgi:hypothetical protein
VDKLREADTVVDALGKAMLDGKAGLSSVPGLVLRVIDEELWRERVVVRTGEVVRFDRFSDFVSTPPLEGLGADLATLKRMCADNPRVLDALDQVSTGRPGGANNPEGHNQHSDSVVNTDNVSIDHRTERSEDHGNGRAYALRRLRNERPDLHEQVLSGELTPHAAMIEAGFRKKTMTLPTGIEDLAATLMRKLTPEQVQQLISYLESAE